MPDLSSLPSEQLLAELISRQRPASSLPAEIVIRHVEQREREHLDSIEIGTAGRGGLVKVYFDATKSDEEIRTRIDAAFRTRAYAQLKMSSEI